LNVVNTYFVIKLVSKCKFKSRLSRISYFSSVKNVKFNKSFLNTSNNKDLPYLPPIGLHHARGP